MRSPPDTNMESVKARSRQHYTSLQTDLISTGFAVSYGILQDYYSSSNSRSDFKGLNVGATGVIGTTNNGVLYMAMPALLWLYAHHRLDSWRGTCAMCGLALSSLSLLLSSWSTSVWQLIVTQGILAAVGSSLLYSSTTLHLDEWFVQRKGWAYGVILSTKSFIATGTPPLASMIITKLGLRTGLRIWAGVILAVGVPGVLVLRPRLNSARARHHHDQSISWKFLTLRTFYIFQIANIVFSSGYGLPQTYLTTYANNVIGLSSTTSSIMLTLFNAPGIIASVIIGLLCDGLSVYSGRPLSLSLIILITALGAALPTLFLWGLSAYQEAAMLSMFSIVYGFFAGGYSATWAGMVRDMDREVRDNGEALDTSLVYGLLNGGRGLGYLLGGFAGAELLKAGELHNSRWGYGSEYGSMILFTGLSAAFGGWSILWQVG